MHSRFTKTDYALWAVIAVYTAIIYSTLSLVAIVRKTIENRFGSEVYNNVYWVFGLIAVAAALYLVRNLRGKRLLGTAGALVATGLAYWYYLSSIDYPLEKIHFLEYGLLGALLLTALRRHVAQWVAALCAAVVVYWIGLGDESIQWLLPNRVGEIRDSITNLFSGGLGIAALHMTTYAHRRSLSTSLAQIRFLLVLAAATTVFTALFLVYVHGFGHVVETRRSGRMYSYFTREQLKRISTSGFLNRRERRIYENEALRHLHQREFYFTNDFRTREGGYYRIYGTALFENGILETHYARYLADRADMYAGELLARMDSEVAEKTMRQPVIWPDSLKTWLVRKVGTPDVHYQSRVKSTVITSYTVRDLLFYVVVILVVLGYAWWRVGRRAPDSGTGLGQVIERYRAGENIEPGKNADGGG
jgi:VanZ family protein